MISSGLGEAFNGMGRARRMPIGLKRAVMVWAIAATMLPHSTAFAEDAAHPALVPEIEATPLPGQPGGVVFHAKPSGLVYKLDAREPTPLPEEFRFDFAHRPAPATGVRLTPAYSAPKGGWSVSGRAGPLRWLTPITADGESVVRFGGRVPDQPRTPGLGIFNLSVHYAFE